MERKGRRAWRCDGEIKFHWNILSSFQLPNLEQNINIRNLYFRNWILPYLIDFSKTKYTVLATKELFEWVINNINPVFFLYPQGQG